VDEAEIGENGGKLFHTILLHCPLRDTMLHGKQTGVDVWGWREGVGQ
jgi:lipopolysaccharide biosynthesis protein